MTPGVKLVKTGNGGTRVYLDGRELSGVTGISVEWVDRKVPVATITITAFLEEYAGEPTDPTE